MLEGIATLFSLIFWLFLGLLFAFLAIVYTVMAVIWLVDYFSSGGRELRRLKRERAAIEEVRAEVIQATQELGHALEKDDKKAVTRLTRQIHTGTQRVEVFDAAEKERYKLLREADVMVKAYAKQLEEAAKLREQREAEAAKIREQQAHKHLSDTRSRSDESS